MTEEKGSWQTLLKEKEYNDLLIEWNKKINLVSRRKPDIYDLIEDSKLFFDKINFKEGVKILDLGTGGGIPGIIIKIHHPEIQITLVDSIQKKINVVTDIVKKLKLENVEVICSRAEELAENPKFRSVFDYAVARSVAPLQDLTKWSKELLKPGGKIIAVKGGDIAGEIHAARKLPYVKSVITTEKDDRKVVVVDLSD
jgi:16S rRNA (guanine527-N7)-methyltransferase